MSVSSATTLISPPAAAPSTTTTTNMQRSNSHHGHTHKARHSHAHHAHHGKRRPSGHTHNTTGHMSAGRRGSESDGGRKVAFAALTMAAMDQAATGGAAKEKRRKSQEERPPAKTTRSDSQLPRLSRTTSVTSNTSSQHAGARPRMKEKDSENSVVVLDDEGHEVEEDEDAEDGDWDDEDSSPVRTKDSKDKDPMSAAMRRTMSESVAAGRTQSPEEIGVQPASITSPVSVKKSLVEPHSLMTRKTTGFSGALHPMPEPEPEPIEPAPLKRVQSVKEMAAQAIDSERKMTARKLAMLDHQQYELEQERQQQRQRQQRQEEGDEGDDARPGAPNRSGSTKGSGLTEDQKNKIETSPSFPFPRVLAPSAAESSAMAQRDASGAGRLYKRSSNTSLRSTTSYRAPPHPLNTQPPIRTAPHSRSGSTAVSPDEFDIRRSMHHPPIAPPVINTESAEGHTWDIPEEREASASAVRQPSSAQAPPISRRDSTTSQRSLRAIFQPTSSRVQASTSASGSGSGQAQRDRLHPSSASADPSRRLTAIEAAAAAAKMHTTTNPALYHQSLGYSPSAAETAHLISRFLPPKRSVKPAWNVTPEMMQDGQPHMGLTEGDYREAHDSLIRQMRDLGNNASSASSRRQDLRRVSKPPLGSLVPPSMARAAEINVGTVKTRNGPLNVSRGGGWRGKTPFELGVERCLAQRPKPAGY